ncbi:MAG: PAS domain-containing protein [Fischerella sp.]|uniref:PAS domain-containing sensor histidine kinase n=1 Tax=Fischerella sp. TaxID=1191 RepID=UPI00178DA3C0|nr:ATP-binding protein [Fischerella sp.]NWF60172.1 PAS domain-containing protein [Fischerella sp.]
MNKDQTISNSPQTHQQESFWAAFLLQVVNAISDPVFVKDHQHRWVLLNDAFCQFMGVSQEKLLGKSDYDFFPKEQADVFWKKVECYAGQINQVFMNILTNAIDALEESLVNDRLSLVDKKEQMNGRCYNRGATAVDGGIKHVAWNALAPSSASHRVGHMTTPQIRICTLLTTDNKVKIKIVDNGPGIPETVKQRLFDPFFTTKPIGKGTGMGLSISYQIITERHGGSLECISQPGSGAEFVISIPLRQT